jgi:Protein of unknown function (DUF2844)
MKTSKRLNLLAIPLLVLSFSFPASAVLGGDESSVATDMVQMKATVKVTPGAAFAVHEVKASSGPVIREYVSPAGRVFGVAWQGSSIPDLHQLLGVYFQQYSEAAQVAKAGHPGRRPLNIQLPGLVVQTGGHMRALYGRAYDPSLLPQGVSADTVR